MNDSFSLVGKNILVTGGTRGLGRAISLQFARSGARVLANFVRDTATAESLTNEAHTESLEITVLRADITTPKGLDETLAAVESQFGKLHGLVHCAATGIHKPLEELSLRHFDWTFNLNVRALFELVRRLLPLFEAGSSILGISSEGATRAVPHYSLVGSSKGALEALLRHLAAELAPRGIRVNIVAPGTLLTDVWKVLPDSERRLQGAIERTPIARLVTLEEVARTAQFLCSQAATGIVGQTVVVDGGANITPCA